MRASTTARAHRTKRLGSLGNSYAKAMRGIETVTGLLTFTGSPQTRLPFGICINADTTIAHLSACRHVLQGQHLKLAREKIRLNMGDPKAWVNVGLLRSTYPEVGVIAREILSLGDQDISPPARGWRQDSPHYAASLSTFKFDDAFDPVNFEDLEPTSLCGVTA